MVCKERELRGELLDFDLPVAKEAGGHHDNGFFLRESALLFHLEEERNDLQRFAKTHVIGENATESDFQILVHPGVAAHLVGAECRVQIFGQRNICFGTPGVELLLEIARHFDRDVVAFAGEARLYEFGLRDFRSGIFFEDFVGGSRGALGVGSFRFSGNFFAVFRRLAKFAFNFIADGLQILFGNLHVTGLVF